MEYRNINVGELQISVMVSDILILSPYAFSSPDKLEIHTITGISNPDINEEYLQIRTDKAYFDFRNFYTIVGALRKIDCNGIIRLENLLLS